MDNNIAKMIDHTILKPNAGDQQIRQLCSEALEYGFASVCINPGFVSLAASLLRDTQVKVCTVIGFPLGSNTSETKLFEADSAMRSGAAELDYVLNISDVLDGRLHRVKQEMDQFVWLKTGSNPPVVIKVILETCYLSDEQIVRVCELAKAAGLDFVKTSTGFAHAGATVEHVRLMRQTVGHDLGVKASGGVRTYEDALAMIEAGASRIGTSSGVEIMKAYGFIIRGQ